MRNCRQVSAEIINVVTVLHLPTNLPGEGGGELNQE